MVSPGFSLNGNAGLLQMLGKFFDCHTRYNMSYLVGVRPCPYGKRRHPLKGLCRDCIPGMIGADCHKFQCEFLRQQVQPAAPTNFNLQSLFPTQLVAGWLAMEATQRQRVDHIFELGPSASVNPAHVNTMDDLRRTYGREEMLVVSNLIHHVRDAVAVDPLMIRQPVWIDKMDASLNDLIDRQMFLPCSMKDILQEYRPLLPMSTIDTFVCLECNDFFLMLNRRYDKVTNL